MGFCHVGQDPPELLTSGNLPASASQSAGITGVSHRAQPGTPLLPVGDIPPGRGLYSLKEQFSARAVVLLGDTCRVTFIPGRGLYSLKERFSARAVVLLGDTCRVTFIPGRGLYSLKEQFSARAVVLLGDTCRVTFIPTEGCC